MGKDSKIEWTHHTFNPWWGCTKVSEGCANCYAEGFAKRTGHPVWGDSAERRFFGDAHWNEPRKWNETCKQSGSTERVFCASMADVFEDREDLKEHRKRLATLIRETPNLTWLLLTKRPENILPLWSEAAFRLSFPPNVWLGTSAENQKWWDTRVPILMKMEVMVHFVSIEPMLGPIDMGTNKLPEWIICGGESGPKVRPIEVPWATSIQEQASGRTAFLFKQWGGRDKKASGRLLHDRTWDEIPQVKL